MVIKTKFLADLLTKLGKKVAAELVVDDSNGVALTFPDISDIAEIAEGVAVDAPDGTYVVANDPDTLTIVVASGKVASVDVASPAPAAEVPEDLNPEIAAVLEAVVDENIALTAKLTALEARFVALTKALKHDEEKAPAGAAKVEAKDKYKIVD